MAFHLPRSLSRHARPFVQCCLPYFHGRVAQSSVHADSYIARQQKRHANGYGAGPQSPGQVAPQPGQPEDAGEDRADGKNNRAVDWGPTLLKMFESAATTVVSLTVLGYVYPCITRLRLANFL